jgi:hypothetical protein
MARHHGRNELAFQNMLRGFFRGAVGIQKSSMILTAEKNKALFSSRLLKTSCH